ncbi:MAG: ATPase, T2SS/T4P/T4SS family [Acidimicrobiia bacterium]|nr:ATPase, T2SS/T4P/T4SS family [Acidimicrobiia bacterium]
MEAGLGHAVGVVERLARRVIAGDVALERQAVADQVRRLIPTEAPLLAPSTISAVVDTVVGLGPLEPLLDEPGVSDILVNSDGSVWVERDGSLQPQAGGFDGPEQLMITIERILTPLGLRLDRASPAVDARLPDGSRLHAMMPPATPDGPVLAIRRFNRFVASLDELVAMKSITAAGADVLRGLVEERSNMLVCGATGSGKTTLLNVLSWEIPGTERVVTVEDAAELQLSGHVVRLEGRPPNSEGLGAITLRELLRHALRLRPDRIVVGEVRGAEAFDLVQALSTGHDGSLSTVHASSAEEALWRIQTLALLEPAATASTLRRQVRSVVDAVVVLGRTEGRRVVSSITQVDQGLTEVYLCS